MKPGAPVSATFGGTFSRPSTHSKQRMIYVADSASVPLRRYGNYSYSPASLGDLIAVLRGEHGEWTFAIAYPRSLDLIQRWTRIDPSDLPQTPRDLEEFGCSSIPRISHGDRVLAIRYAREVILGRFGNPDSMGRELLTSLVPTESDHWMDINDWELAWIDFQADTK